MQWLRLWVDAVDDEKLKLLAFEDRWHYIAILCLKRKGTLDVDEPESLRDRKVGAKLGVDDRNRDEIRRRLTEVGLVDEQWQPLGWDKRQYASDADPTALQRKQKQRHGRVTRDKKASHGPVTDESRAGHTAQSQIQTTESEKNVRLSDSSPSTQRKLSSLNSSPESDDLKVVSETENRARLSALTSSVAQQKKVLR